MKNRTSHFTICLTQLLTAGLLICGALRADADPALTIYNQNFAVVRDTVSLNLTPGLNHVQVSNITAQAEPDSVVLRDPTGQHQLQVVEQFYRADPISQGLLLSQYEGKTLSFRVRKGTKEEIVEGKVIRSGYTPGIYNASSQPIIEVNGQLRFSLPGEPIFPTLPDDAILKPTLNWLLQTDQSGPINAEMAYITNGMTWKADYNLVAPANSDGPNENLDLTGWVTLSNNTGKTFENAHIKLMAGDVSRIDPTFGTQLSSTLRLTALENRVTAPPNVTEKNFDDYHLYTIGQSTTLRDRETKQIEFTHATAIKSSRAYIYDGVQLDNPNYLERGINNSEDYGTKSNTKVAILREFQNTKANGLGIALPKGRVRFYQRDVGGQLEFLGENNIDHTPKDETIKVYTGNAFDIVGERKRTNFKYDYNKNYLDESFEINLRNHKPKPVEVRVIEHLYRGPNWSITQKSNVFLKNDSHTIEFRVLVPADGAQTVTYTTHYTWE